MLKRFTLSLFFLAGVCALAVFFEQMSSGLPVSRLYTPQRTVILDAGHGGFDGGAVAPDGTVEKDINLKIALTLRDLLWQDGFFVIMTRQTDTSTENIASDKITLRKKNDMQNRLKLMSDYPDAVFISVHLNKFTTSAAQGAQIFYGGKSPESALLGENIRKAVTGMLQPENIRMNKQATAGTYLLYNAPIPAVLVECGFLSNKTELSLLKKDEYQRKMAFCIFCGIHDYFTDKS